MAELKWLEDLKRPIDGSNMVEYWGKIMSLVESRSRLIAIAEVAWRIKAIRADDGLTEQYRWGKLDEALLELDEEVGD